MKKTQTNGDLYPIPYTARCKMGLFLQMLIFLLVLIFSAVLWIPNNGDPELVFYKTMAVFLDLLFLTTWIYNGILKKSFIHLDEQGITLKNFSTKRVNWVDVEFAQTYEQNHNAFIGLIPKKHPVKRNPIARFFQSEYSLSISLRLFSAVDPEKLFATISFLIRNAYIEEDRQLPIQGQPEKVVLSNQAALRKAFGIFLLTSAADILLSALLREDLIVISCLASLGMVTIYQKNCEAGHVPSLHRILLGFFSSVPILLIPFSSLLWANKEYAQLVGIWETARQCIKAVVSDPQECGIFYWVAAAMFLYAALDGLNIKFIRKIKRIYKKKQNGFYMEKGGRYLLIYLIDYVDYDDSLPKTAVEISANQCLIERNKKKIGAFYLPVKIFADLQMRVNSFQFVRLEGEDYYKLDLGGHEKPVAYGYNCLLLLNEEREPEVICLEKS